MVSASVTQYIVLRSPHNIHNNNNNSPSFTWLFPRNLIKKCFNVPNLKKNI